MNFSDFIEEYGKPQACAVGEYVFRQGDAGASIYHVEEGLLKAYYLAEDGKEHIKSFIAPGDVIGSLSAVYAKGTCSYSLVCLEQVKLIELPFDAMFELAHNHQDMANSLMEILLKFAMKKEQREYELLCLSAENRYRLLAEQSPHFLEKVTQENIARYLGITPVALSRIKKRVTKD